MQMAISMRSTDDEIMNQFFDRLQNNIDYTLWLFTEDAVIYEPFSFEHGLRGREEIRKFLQVAQMATKGGEIRIDILSSSNDGAEEFVRLCIQGGSVASKYEFTTLDEGLKMAPKRKSEKLEFNSTAKFLFI